MHLACKFVFKLPGNRKLIGKHKIFISKFIRLLIVIICTKISSLSKLYVSLDFFFQISTNLKLSINKINFSWRISNFIYLAKNPQDSPLRVVIATVALVMTGEGDLRYVSQVIHVGPPKTVEGKFCALQNTWIGTNKKLWNIKVCLMFKVQ